MATALPAVAAQVGDALRLGQSNAVNANTQLRGNTAANLVIKNTGSGIPLSLVTGKNGRAPLKVDSGKRVARLNADRLDSMHARDFVWPLYAVVATDGTLLAGEGVVGVATVPPGEYDVTFERSVVGCALTATIGEPNSEPAGLIDTARFKGNAIVTVFTQAPDGAPPALENRAFSLVVTCGPNAAPADQAPSDLPADGEPVKGSDR